MLCGRGEGGREGGENKNDKVCGFGILSVS